MEIERENSLKADPRRSMKVDQKSSVTADRQNSLKAERKEQEERAQNQPLGGHSKRETEVS
jgi:hypothetical protein